MDKSNFNILPDMITSLSPKLGVLYICQSGTSGYANAAKGYIYSLIKEGIKLTVRSIEMDDTHESETSNFDEIISQRRQLIPYNTVIVHTTPDMWNQLLNNMDLVNKRVIGRTVWEFDKLIPKWVDAINNSVVHTVSVPTEWNKTVFENSGVIKPIVVEPHINVTFPYTTVELKKLIADTGEIFFDGDKSELNPDNYYKFYTIGQFIPRKGVAETIEAFCKSFIGTDNVILIVKTFGTNYSGEQVKECRKKIQTIIDQNKSYAGHAPIIFLKSSFSYDEMESLHEQCDCYVQLTHTEGFGLGIFDAYNRGKKVIVTGHGGHVEYLGKDYAGLVEYELTPVKDNIFFQFTLDESYTWAIPSIVSAKNKMLEVSNKISKISKIETVIDTAEEIYFGDGIHDLEGDNGKYFRWFSDLSVIYILHENMEAIELNVFSEYDCTSKITNRDGVEEYKLKQGTNCIKINHPFEKILCEQDYFIPSIVYKTSDTRKLSFRLVSVNLKYKDGTSKVLGTQDIKFITSYRYDELISKNETGSTEDGNKTVVSYGEYGEMFIKPKHNNVNGKLNLNQNQISFYSHRSGWDVILTNLFNLHNDNGVLFDGFLENAFIWRKEDSIKNNIIPYKTPWIGVFHNPPNMPSWFSDNGAYPCLMIKDKYFRSSLRKCKGLYVLSEYHADYLRIELPDIPIDVLHLSTEIPENIFNFDKFIGNEDKSIVNIGWWLRKLNSFYLLDSSYKKIRLLPNNKCKDTIKRLSKIERSLFNIKLTKEQNQSVNLIDHISNEEYDELLSKNIVFLDLYDSSANNAIVECIARATPLLINKHPAVMEYLGKDYPFYFDNHADASSKLNNIGLILETHNYLLNCEARKDVSIESFLKKFEDSPIYRSLSTTPTLKG